ncbi:autophagy protein [Chytridiales sp. JEL 0842]|nr:autophagy protein [Chytridiales sp. JEL 0842]
MSITSSGPTQPPLLHLSFNQDSTCISLSTPSSYKIYNLDPFGRFYKSPSGGVGIVEMLFCTSLVALVGEGGGGGSPRRLGIVNTKLLLLLCLEKMIAMVEDGPDVLFDDEAGVGWGAFRRQSTICELTFVTAILAVKLNRRRLVVVLEEHIYIYDIGNMKLLHTIDTSPNPNALCALSPSSQNSYLAYPPNTTGNSGELLLFDAINLQAVNIVQAHKSALSCVEFSKDGTMVATASDKGTVIRVFSVPNGDQLFQFRRGTYPARIHSIAFDVNNMFLGVTSDTETVHVFRLQPPSGSTAAGGAGTDGSSLHTPTTPTTPISASSSFTSTSNAHNQNPPSNTNPASKSTMSNLFSSASSLVSSSITTVYSTVVKHTPPVVSNVGSKVGSMLIPGGIAGMWEPQRDWAHAKVNVGGVQSGGGGTGTGGGGGGGLGGVKTVCALSWSGVGVGGGLGGGAAVKGDGGSVNGAGEGGASADLMGSGAGSGSVSSTAAGGGCTLMVASSSGWMYQYAVDVMHGGECVLLKEFSFLEGDEEI